MFKILSKTAGFFGYVIQYGALTHCTFEYLGDLVICSGPSMEPTLYTDNILITERVSVRRRRIDRGDIIIAKSPVNPIQHVCKRVIGLPGDRVFVHPSFNLNPFGNKHYSKKSTVDEADEDVLIEDYDFQHKSSTLKSGEFVVPRGYVWIEGDNAENSSDSRYYGPIPIGLIRSRAVCRLWPLSEVKMLT